MFIELLFMLKMWNSSKTIHLALRWIMVNWSSSIKVHSQKHMVDFLSDSLESSIVAHTVSKPFDGKILWPSSRTVQLQSQISWCQSMARNYNSLILWNNVHMFRLWHVLQRIEKIELINESWPCTVENVVWFVSMLLKPLTFWHRMWLWQK